MYMYMYNFKLQEQCINICYFHHHSLITHNIEFPTAFIDVSVGVFLSPLPMSEVIEPCTFVHTLSLGRELALAMSL